MTCNLHEPVCCVYMRCYLHTWSGGNYHHVGLNPWPPHSVLPAGTTLRRPELMATAASLADAGSHCAEGTRASTGLPNAAAAVRGEMGGG